MKIVGFSTPKPRQFKYKPRYYNEEQEEFEQRLHKARLEGEASPDREALRIKMQKSWKLKEAKEKKRAGIRNLLIIFFLILLALYMIFF